MSVMLRQQSIHPIVVLSDGFPYTAILHNHFPMLGPSLQGYSAAGESL